MIGINSERPARKVAQVRSRIRSIAVTAGVGSKLPTVRHLCESCSASLSTVDRALQDLEAQGILERRHGSGIYVGAGAANTRICLLMGHDVMSSAEVSPFYPALRSRLAGISRERHWEVTPHIASVTVDGEHRNQISKELRYALEAGFIDGIIATISLHGGAAANFPDIPVASFLPTASTPSTISIDYNALARLGVLELAAVGRRSIALITILGYARQSGFTDDLDGFAQGLQQCGLPWRSDRIIEAPAPIGQLNEETSAAWRGHGYAAMRRLLDSPDPPDAVVVNDDMAAMGVLQALQERPANVLVATHSNRGSSSETFLDLPCIVLEIDPGYIADRLVALLDDMLHGRLGSSRNERIFPRVLRSPALSCK